MRRRAAAARHAIGVALGVTALCAASPVAFPAQRARPAPRPASAASRAAEPRTADAEEARYYRRAVALRARILGGAAWAELDSAACRTGALRVFPAESAGVSAAADDVAELEHIIIARGVENSLDTPAAHELFRAVIGWEVGAARPEWDVTPGAMSRSAIAAGPVGDVPNPETGKCEAPLRPDTAIVVLPPEARLTTLQVAGATVRVVLGEEGLNRLRDAFFAAHGQDLASVLAYTRVSAAVVWRDFAVVAVNRRAEGRGVVSLPNADSGAAYIFHRAGSQWRLLTITRVWS